MKKKYVPVTITMECEIREENHLDVFDNIAENYPDFFLEEAECQSRELPPLIEVGASCFSHYCTVSGFHRLRLTQCPQAYWFGLFHPYRLMLCCFLQNA